MLQNLLFYLIGFGAGALITWHTLNPKKVIKDTYEKASKDFTDWKKWYSKGWDDAFAATKHIAEAYESREIEHDQC